MAWNRQDNFWIKTVLPAILAVVLVALVTGFLLLVRNQVETATVVLLYLLPVGAGAAAGGLWPGVLAALVSFLSLNYFFIRPYGTLMVHRSQDLLALLVFLVLAVSISQLVGRITHSLNTARARENETTRLYELSQSLAGLNQSRDILEALARHILISLQAESVEVFTREDTGPILVSMPANLAQHPNLQRPPDRLIPLQGTSQLVGEIRLWRAGNPLSATEERLLTMSASQCLLALERSQLAASERLRRILQESDKMKSSLLSSVSHELRTPLATIKASVSSLRSGDVAWETEARQDLLAAIDEETDRLNQLVGNLLNMSRIEAGGLQLKKRWNVLEEIVSGSVKRARALNTGHFFEVEIPDDLPLIFVDDVLMEQVFNNLLSNSAKYSPAGGVIHVRAAKQGEDAIQVQVSNQGPAVAETDLVKIFDKFHRVTAQDKVTGTGLGLSICKGIIEAHQGNIWAENLDQGFGILFTLPIHAGGGAPRVPQQ